MSICDIPVIAGVCTTAGEAAAGWMFESVWTVFDTTTLVDVTRPEYLAVYNVLFGVAVFVMLAFFGLQLITGLVHRDPTALSRAGVGLAKSVLGSFVLVTITALLLEITDQLCLGIVQATGQTMQSMGDKIILLTAGLTTINIAAPGVGAIITIFLAGLAIAAAAIVWLSLLVRKALLLVAVVFGLVALAGLTWDVAKGWFGKWASFVVAMILSKLVVAGIFLVAVAQVAAPSASDLTAVTEPVAGIVLMFIAAFAPYMAYKFISFVGFDVHQAMSMEQEAKSALNRPVPVPSLPDGGTPPRQVLESGGSGSSKPSPGPAPTAASSTPDSPAAGTAGPPSTPVPSVPKSRERSPMASHTQPYALRPVQFSRLTRRGILLGLSLPQLITLGLALVIIVLSLYTGGGAGLAWSSPAVTPLVAISWAPIGGRRVIEWAPIVVGWLARTCAKQTEYRRRIIRPRPAGTLALPGDLAAPREWDGPETGAAMIHAPQIGRSSCSINCTPPNWNSSLLDLEFSRKQRVPGFSFGISGTRNS